MIPIHPQACLDRPDELRWVTPAGVLSFVGTVTTAPDPLQSLLDDGTLTEVRVEPAALVTRIGAGRSWPLAGARVRTALHAALARPADWRTDGQPSQQPVCGDAALAAATRDLIEGRAGLLARSHGGGIELVDVHDGVVEIRLTAACNGCPAAATTLRVQLEGRLRAGGHDLKAVRQV